MKAASLHGAAVAVALIAGVQLAASKASPSDESCPWVSKHAAVLTGQPSPQVSGEIKPAEDPDEFEPAVPHPMRTVDCARDGWRRFGAPGFDSQEACVGWVLEYLRPRMIETLPPGDAREFDFPQHGNGTGGAILRTGAPLLI